VIVAERTRQLDLLSRGMRREGSRWVVLACAAAEVTERNLHMLNSRSAGRETKEAPQFPDRRCGKLTANLSLGDSHEGESGSGKFLARQGIHI